MRMPMNFKIPSVLKTEYAQILNQHDWREPLNLSEAMPGLWFEPWDVIKEVRPGVVAANRLGTMLRMRRAADAVAEEGPIQSAEETARVLALRNPAKEVDLTEGETDEP